MGHICQIGTIKGKYDQIRLHRGKYDVIIAK